MARLWSCGFELQSATSGMEWDTTTNSPTIDTTTKRSGAASLRCNPTATTAYISHAVKATAPTSDLYIRFYLYIHSSTNALDSILLLRDSSEGSNYASIRLNSNRTLELWNEAVVASQIGSDSSALNADQWYRIELAYDYSATTLNAYIDGVSFASGSGQSIGEQPELIRFGAVTSTTCDIYIDDIAVNDETGTAQNSLPGAGSIVHMQPDGAGDNNNASSGDYTDVDEVTPDGATTKAVLDADNDILDVTCESSSNAGIGSSDTITLVQVGIHEGAVSAAAESWALRIKSASGGTTTQGTTTSHNDTTYKTNGDTLPKIYTLTSYTDPTTSSAWTPTGTNSLDNMQIGVKAIDATPDINVSTLWALVEYIPTTTTSQTILGKSRITTTTSQTILGKANIGSGDTTTPQTITGKSRITTTSTNTISGKSRVGITSSQTIQGESRIVITTPQTIQGKSRITSTSSQTISGKSRVTVSTSQTIQGKSRITISTPNTLLGKSKITVSQLQVVLGIARVTTSTSQAIAGKSRVAITTTQTILGNSRIGLITSQVIQGLSRITASTSQAIQGKSRISDTTSRTIQGQSKITTVSQQTIQGIARITETTTKAIQGVSRITVLTTSDITGKASLLDISSQALQGMSRVQDSSTQVLQGKSRVTTTTNQTLQGLARIALISSQTILGQSRIEGTTTQVVTGKASIVNSGVDTTQDILGMSRITTSTPQTIKGKANIMSNIAPTPRKWIIVDGRLAWRITDLFYIKL